MKLPSLFFFFIAFPFLLFSFFYGSVFFLLFSLNSHGVFFFLKVEGYVILFPLIVTIVQVSAKSRNNLYKLVK